MAVIPVIVISLGSAQERREQTHAHLAARGIPFSFFDGVDGGVLTPGEVAALDPRPYVGHFGRKLSPGEIGCAASYARLFETIARGPDEFVCIAEDDCLLAPDAVGFLDRDWLRGLPPFDVLRLVDHPIHRRKGLAVAHARVGHRAVLAPLRSGFLTTAQVFSRAGAKKILHSMIPLRAPVDNFIYRDASVPGLRVLEVQPPVVEERPVPTTMVDRFPVNGHKPSMSATIHRALFLVTRRVRAVTNFVRAWGIASLFRLRPKRRYAGAIPSRASQERAG